MVVSAALSYTVLRTRAGEWMFLWRTAPLASFHADGGFAYTSPTGLPDLSSHERPSTARVLENGQLLGPPNAQHADIRSLGRGRYSFWHDHVYVSATDNSDPAANGRAYSISYAPITRPVARLLYGATAVLWLLGSIPLLGVVRSLGWRQLGTRAAAGAAGIAEMVPAWKVSLSSLVAIWLMVMALAAASETIFLTRMGQWTWLWQEEEVGAFQPEQGFAFIAGTGRPEVGSHNAPQATALLENGVQLGLRNAGHAEIREVGRGRYSFWHDYVIFATSDNTDPRTNGRRYTMQYPPVSRLAARLLYGVTVLAFVSAFALTLMRVRAGTLQVPPVLLAWLQRFWLPALVALSAVSLLLPAAMRASPTWSPGVEHVWPIVIALHLAAAIALRATLGPVLPRAIFASTLLALVAGYAILTVWAPHRTQGCHTTHPYSVWAMYCVAPDSASYYTGYFVGSTRQPLYPWFIAAVTANSGFEPRKFMVEVAAGEPRVNPAEPLFRVVRVQLVLMLAASLAACAVLMRLLRSPLPAIVFLWLYDMQFFSAGELNFVLTEPLVQTFIFLLVAALAAALVRLRPAALVGAAVACGLAYLTRQASAYSALLLLVVIAMALLEDYRRWWKLSAVSLAVFAGICAVPDLYALATTGNIGRQQQSLQYQYRIAHAMHYARPEDVALMPDEESRQWLVEAMARRDPAHRIVEEKFAADEYSLLVYYVNANLYEAAIPPGHPARTPEFYMKVATPILVKHWREYAAFAFRFWVVALEKPYVSRLGVYGFSPWLTYLTLFVLAVYVRGWRGVAGAALIVCHLGAVAMSCLFAAPIPRMVWASEFLVVLSALLLIWSAGERAVPAMRRRAAALAPLPAAAPPL
jgi:hypothetical protein